MIKHQISTKLDKLPIEEIALCTNFSVHSDNQITAKSLLLSFFMMINTNANTLFSWTNQLIILLQKVFSISGLRSKLSYRQVDFAEALLKECLKQELFKASNDDLSSDLLSFFNRVLVEDSTCIKLPDNLASIFRGAYSKTKGLVATARIQCRIDLKQNHIVRLAIQAFRDNDQKFSVDIVEMLQPKDLVLRDLGYWSLKVFRQILDKQAYLLSRLRYGTNLYDLKGVQINLHQHLEKSRRKGLHVVTISVLVGKEEQLPLQLVAIKVPAKQVEQRKRKAKKNRSKKSNHSKEYMELLEWTIFVTNVPDDVWTPQQMLKVYGFRWRIEIIFKCWKSNFNLSKLFEKKQSIAPPRAWITFYFLLVWITLFFNPLFNFVFARVAKTKQRFISIIKFAKLFKEHFSEAMNVWFIVHELGINQAVKQSDVHFFIQLAAKNCAYDKKNKTSNYCQNLYMLNFNTR